MVTSFTKGNITVMNQANNIEPNGDTKGADIAHAIFESTHHHLSNIIQASRSNQISQELQKETKEHCSPQAIGFEMQNAANNTEAAKEGGELTGF